jgi:hypothetical protein
LSESVEIWRTSSEVPRTRTKPGTLLSRYYKLANEFSLTIHYLEESAKWKHRSGKRGNRQNSDMSHHHKFKIASPLMETINQVVNSFISTCKGFV